MNIYYFFVLYNHILDSIHLKTFKKIIGFGKYLKYFIPLVLFILQSFITFFKIIKIL